MKKLLPLRLTPEQYVQINLMKLFRTISAEIQFNLHTGQERLIRSHSSTRFCFELSGNSN